MSERLALMPLVEILYRQLGITDLIPEDDFQAGLAELEAAFARVAFDAHVANCRQVPLRHAVQDQDEFPHLHRAHAVIGDLLSMSIPAEFARWMQRVLRMPLPPVGATLEAHLARMGMIDDGPIGSACRFLLFEGTRMALQVATWRTHGGFEAVGGEPRDVEAIAEDRVRALVDAAGDLPADVRPLELLVATAMQHLTAHAEGLRAALGGLQGELVEMLEQQAAIELEMRTLDPVDALLLRNQGAELFGEPRRTIEALQQAHPLILGPHRREALDQRVSRLKQRLQAHKRKAVHHRKRPSLLEVVATIADGEDR